MIILPRYSFTLTNFISSLCTEMSRPKCLETETTKTEKSRDRNGQTEKVRSHRPDRNGSDWSGQTESARPKRPNQ